MTSQVIVQKIKILNFATIVFAVAFGGYIAYFGPIMMGPAYSVDSFQTTVEDAENFKELKEVSLHVAKRLDLVRKPSLQLIRLMMLFSLLIVIIGCVNSLLSRKLLVLLMEGGGGSAIIGSKNVS